jgi:hypothetical protein
MLRMINESGAHHEPAGDRPPDPNPHEADLRRADVLHRQHPAHPRVGRPARSTALAITVWTASVLGIMLGFAVITCWYLIWGLFLVPYRLLRRQQRKSQHLQRAQLATMQAMMADQMKQPEDK